MSGLFDGLLGGGGGGLGGMLGGLPIVGGLFGGGGGSAPAQGTYQATPSYPAQSFAGGPWPSFPGQPNGNPQPQKFTGDFSGPGPAEAYFAQNQGKYTDPSANRGQAWWDANKGKFGAGVADQYWNGLQGHGEPPPGTDFSQQAYNQFQGSTPADTSPYYQNALRQANEATSKAYAARGMRGGSAEQDQLAENATNILGAQANADAQYGLARAGLAGQLGQGADTSNARNIQDQLSWMTGLGTLGLGTQNSDLQRLLGAGGLAQGVDQNMLSWLNGGMNAASAAQAAMAERGQNFFGNNLAATQAEVSPMMAAYMAMLQNDAALQQGAIDASTGYAREGANQSVTGRASSEQGIGNLFGLFGGGKSGGFLGGIL